MAGDLRNLLVDCGLDNRIAAADLQCALQTMSKHGELSRNVWRCNAHFCLSPNAAEAPQDQTCSATPSVVPSFWSSSAEGSTLVEILSQNINKLVDESSNNEQNNEPQNAPREEAGPSSPTSPAKTLPLGHAKHVPDGNRLINNVLQGEFINWLFSHHHECKRPKFAHFFLSFSRNRLAQSSWTNQRAVICFCCYLSLVSSPFHLSLPF